MPATARADRIPGVISCPRRPACAIPRNAALRDTSAPWQGRQGRVQPRHSTGSAPCPTAPLRKEVETEKSAVWNRRGLRGPLPEAAPEPPRDLRHADIVQRHWRGSWELLSLWDERLQDISASNSMLPCGNPSRPCGTYSTLIFWNARLSLSER